MSWFRKKKVVIESPAKGMVVELEQVPDQVFSTKMLGDGFAVIPEEGLICAPVSGKIGSFFPTGHAFGIEAEHGVEVLVHIGVDTVELNGEGFRALKEEGQEVKAGEPVVEVDLQLLKQRGKETITPVIITVKEGTLELQVDFKNKTATAVLGS